MSAKMRCRWTPEEDALLKKLRAEGVSPIAIADRLRRAEGSVYRRIEVLAVQVVRKERSCMCCRNTFMSDGPHNRLCTKCGGRSFSSYHP